MFFGVREKTLLENQVDRAVRELDKHEVASQEYSKILKVVETLHHMKEEEIPAPVSKNTLAIIGGNLLGIFMIIQHERVNVITSRAMSLVLKP